MSAGGFGKVKLDPVSGNCHVKITPEALGLARMTVSMAVTGFELTVHMAESNLRELRASIDAALGVAAEVAA